ncbi:unnamed protein product, partial [Discosporangium mesarthrocarpum]
MLGSAASMLLNASDPLSGSGPGTCSDLFNNGDGSLGVDPQCLWADDRTLEVTLGYGTFIEPDPSLDPNCPVNKSVALKPWGVRTEAGAVLFSTGCKTVLSPVNPVSPFAVISSPQVVGYCGDFTLDGRSSSGGAGRALSGMWKITSYSNETANVSKIMDSLAAANGSLLATIGVDALEPGVQFEIALWVKNFLSQQYHVATVSVVRRLEAIPLVSTIGAASRSMQRGKAATVRVRAEQPSCGNNGSFSYSWEDAPGNSYTSLGSDIVERLSGHDPTALVIPAYTLGYPGSSYRFRCSVYDQIDPALNASTMIEITVSQGPVRAVISGGSHRLHWAGEDLKLDGTASVDEDDITELPFRYSWACTGMYPGNGSNAWPVNGSAFESQANGTVVVRGGYLGAGQVYTIELNVSKGNESATNTYGSFRSDSFSLTVEVVAYSPPAVAVTAKSSKSKHNPEKKLV